MRKLPTSRNTHKNPSPNQFKEFFVSQKKVLISFFAVVILMLSALLPMPFALIFQICVIVVFLLFQLKKGTSATKTEEKNKNEKNN